MSEREYVALETSRLRLAVPEEHHAAEIYRSFSADPEVTRYLTWTPATSFADAERAMTGRLERLHSGTEYSWIILRKNDTEVIGSLALWPKGDNAELGFALAQSAWGHGLAGEAALAAIEWLRNAGSAKRVWAACDVDNLRSKRVLQKLGMQFEERVDAMTIHPNLSPEPRACYVFGLELNH